MKMHTMVMKFSITVMETMTLAMKLCVCVTSGMMWRSDTAQMNQDAAALWSAIPIAVETAAAKGSSEKCKQKCLANPQCFRATSDVNGAYCYLYGETTGPKGWFSPGAGAISWKKVALGAGQESTSYATAKHYAIPMLVHDKSFGGFHPPWRLLLLPNTPRTSSSAFSLRHIPI